MKFIKNFSLFENLESEIDLLELESILIDFKQMGLDHDIKVGSSIVIDWREFNDVNYGGSKCLNSSDIDKYTGLRTGNSLTIEFTTSSLDFANPNGSAYSYNINDTAEAYEMTCEYLGENYGLRPNYILTQRGFTLVYFKDFQHIKAYMETELAEIKKQSPSGVNQWGQRERVFGSDTSEYFYSTKLTLGFWK